ncbi:hypothetical protein [Hutsoniella sourekii]|uniref:hypothetical protein n=1 Tax=Hutsoniella sourekii TaxID=87650 RepID=UPI00048478FE|nr:hypothetical protein [Hutsoniella sourekii]
MIDNEKIKLNDLWQLAYQAGKDDGYDVGFEAGFKTREKEIVDWITRALLESDYDTAEGLRNYLLDSLEDVEYWVV